MKTHFFRRAVVATTLVACTLSLSALADSAQGGLVQTASVLNMRTAPSTDASIVDRLENDTALAILAQSGDWYEVALDGATGYVHSDYVQTKNTLSVTVGSATVTADVLNLRAAPNTDSTIVSKLQSGDVVEVVGINEGWFSVTVGTQTGYVHPDYITFDTVAATSNTAATGTRQDIIDYAANYLGVPYVYGGSSPSGFDCSGFVVYVLDNFDIDISRTSSAQYGDVTKLDRSELQVGDLVFFSNGSAGKVGHVGIYVGNDEFIHATSPGGVVQYDSLDSSYYSKNYIGAGTIL